MVDQRNGGASATAGRRQLQHQGECSDAAGNAATTASQAITVDETSPTIAITSPVAGDNIINKTEASAGVTISGSAAAGSAAVDGQTATITIVDSANAIKDTIRPGDAAGMVGQCDGCTGAGPG